MRQGLKALTGLCAMLAISMAAPIATQAGSFGFKEAKIHTFQEDESTAATQAGSHPYSVEIKLAAETELDPGTGKEIPPEDLKDLAIDFPPGLVGSPYAIPRCPMAVFLAGEVGECSDSTALGTTFVAVGEITAEAPLYNLEPAPGTLARLGFIVAQRAPVVVDAVLSPQPPYHVISRSTNTSQALFFHAADVTVWGVPAASAHDAERGRCLKSGDACQVSLPQLPLVTLPTNCESPLTFGVQADSWQNPAHWVQVFSNVGDPGPPLSATGCEKLRFSPQISAKSTSRAASSPTGLDFSIDHQDEGINAAAGLSHANLRKAVITLPEGVTANPSAANGLEVCSEARLAQESAASGPGEGCPEASKLGAIEVQTPLVPQTIGGSLYLAKPYENPFGTLLALYMVLKNTELGVSIKLPLRVVPDQTTGRLVVSTEDGLPQFPFTHFNLHFREGARSPLVTPSGCGSYPVKAALYPWSGGEPIESSSSFQILTGPNGTPCPPAGVPPFKPRFEAGAVNNDAGSFSPFEMRLTREDGEQDMTKFSATLPPGELGSLAGVSKCPDSAIGAAKAKSGLQELASPSCPANSLIGHTLAGAGVGPVLTYVGGKVYLGGPYHGDPLSVIAITPAVAGPFDAGTVVVREALTLNPKTAEVEVDGAASDPLPHILQGIVLKIRDLRVSVDRPNFTLNPTSCEEEQTRSVIFGSYLNVLDPGDDRPVDLGARYQAASCASLGFKPHLALNLDGGTRRGGHPGLTAVYTPRKGDANIRGLVVRLSRSAFLDQAHIKTICTRVQFATKACPKASQYGYVKAFTPLLDEPLQGPVYLRSSNHKLPDLVLDLHGLVDVEVSIRIDSQNGGIRATMEDAPDATLSKVVLQMQGANKGLIVNSRNLCGHKSKANVQFSGQNGKETSSNPVMKADCGGKRKHKRHRG